MRKPILIDYRDGKATFRQIAAAERLKLETVRHRYYRQKPSKRPRTHVQ